MGLREGAMKKIVVCLGLLAMLLASHDSLARGGRSTPETCKPDSTDPECMPETPPGK
jgi:hypothetical protein